MTYPKEIVEKARELRAAGLSGRQISVQLGPSAKCIEKWTRDVPLSIEARARLNKRRATGLLQRVHDGEEQVRRRARAQVRTTAALQQAEIEWPALQADPRFMFFLGLYAGEGDKTGNVVGLSNADPALMKIAVSWFVALGIDSLKMECRVITHDDAAPDAEITAFWRAELGLQRKVHIVRKPAKTSKSKRKLRYGCCYVRATCRRISVKIKRWLHLSGYWMGVEVYRTP